MGSESIAHEAEGRMSCWLRRHEGEGNNFFGKIQPVGQKYPDKTTLASKTQFRAGTFRAWSSATNYSFRIFLRFWLTKNPPANSLQPANVNQVCDILQYLEIGVSHNLVKVRLRPAVGRKEKKPRKQKRNEKTQQQQQQQQQKAKQNQIKGNIPV